MMGVAVHRLITQSQKIPNQLDVVLFFSMIVLAGIAVFIFWLTHILPKEKDIEETQQAIFYEMTINRSASVDQTRVELNMIHKIAQVKIHDSEFLTSSTDFLLMRDEIQSQSK